MRSNAPRRARPGSTSATVARVESIGLRELRQSASELVRRVEQGEEIEVTVAGRPAARLVPIPEAPRTWRRWEDVASIFSTEVDVDWAEDRDLIDHSIVDPWDRFDESAS